MPVYEKPRVFITTENKLRSTLNPAECGLDINKTTQPKSEVKTKKGSKAVLEIFQKNRCVQISDSVWLTIQSRVYKSHDVLLVGFDVTGCWKQTSRKPISTQTS